MDEKTSEIPPEIAAIIPLINKRQADENRRLAANPMPRLGISMRKQQEAFEKHREKFGPLITASRKSIECEIHKGFKRKINFASSLQACWQPDDLRLVYDPCDECQHEILVNEKCRKWICMGLPKRTAHANFDNFITGNDPRKTEVLKAVQTQVYRRKGFLILFGLYGTGKTHLMSAAFKQLVNHTEKKEGIFITFGELIDQLRDSYDDNSKTRLVKRLQMTPVLVVDELERLGKSRGEEIQSSDIQPFLLRIFGYRYDRDLFTGLTSNEDLATVMAILGKRLEDRISQNYTSKSCAWDSYRRANRVTD